MANNCIIYDDTNNTDSMEISPDYEDKTGSPGVKLILDLKGEKKFRNIYLSREDAKELIKKILDIIA